jgi:hypothetical protein
MPLLARPAVPVCVKGGTPCKGVVKLGNRWAVPTLIWLDQSMGENGVFLHGGIARGEEESSAGWLATVDQPDIRGLVTDMT